MGNANKKNCNLVKVLSLFSEKTRESLFKENMKGLARVQNIISDYSRYLQKNKTHIGMAITNEKPFDIMQKRILEEFRRLYSESKILKDYDLALIFSIADLQAITMLMANLSGATQMLKDVQMSLAAFDLARCIRVMQDTLFAEKISMPDLAFFKSSDLPKTLRDEMVFPKGFSSGIAKLNKNSAIKLADNHSIIYDINNRKFVNEDNLKSMATIEEMNVVCGAENLLDVVAESEELFTENELMDFMTYLDSNPTMGMNNKTGKRIYNIVSSFLGRISFDKKNYYHCRPRGKTEAPFVWDQMKCAPYGVTSSGRYNHEGQAYFYVSDTKNGAEKEVLKHMNKGDKVEMVLQTIELETIGSADMIDLSKKSMRGLNVFLRFIRFPLEGDLSRRPRVYLIPSFVSDCCRVNGIDGIKYYGGKDYSNYVTWSDKYYSFKRNV